jgi:hypothetical protein
VPVPAEREKEERDRGSRKTYQKEKNILAADYVWRATDAVWNVSLSLTFLYTPFINWDWKRKRKRERERERERERRVSGC